MMGICGTTFITVLFCLVSQRVATPESAAQQKLVYVLPTTPAVPSESSLCSTSQCYSLKELGTWENFTSHTTIMLLPGTHTISGNDSDTILHIENVHDFSIIGLDTETSNSIPKIQCLSGGVFQIDLHGTARLTLNGFEITNCNTEEYERFPDFFPANIQIFDSVNVTIEQVMVYYGGKVGLMMRQVYGHIAILHSEFSHNGANCHMDTVRVYPAPTIHTEWYNINLTITDTLFTFGEEVDNNIAGGLNVILKMSEYTFDVHITNITLHENYGNLHIRLDAGIPSNVNIHELISTHSNNNNYWSIDSSIVLQMYNKVYVYVSNIFILRSDVTIRSAVSKPKQNSGTHLKNITFVEGTTGASLQFWDIENGTIEDIVFIKSTKPLVIESSNVTIRGECIFTNNMYGIKMSVGSILTIGPDSTVEFEDNTCGSTQEAVIQRCATITADSSNIIVDRNSHLVFRNNTGSSSGAIALHRSNIHVLSNVSILFDSNSGTNGGAISLYAGSRISFCERTNLLERKNLVKCWRSRTTFKFVTNYASEKGGGVYIDDAGYVNPFTGKLEFQDQRSWDIISSAIQGNFKAETVLYFVNNTADIAGNALYGGWIVYNHQRILNFDDQQHDLSTVASNPVRVCMCVALEPNCTVSEHMVTTYPGQTVEIEAVAVGQGLGTVPSIVHATITSIQTNSESTLREGQYVQQVARNCTTLQYTVLSMNDAETIQLTVEAHSMPNLYNMLNSLQRIQPNDLHSISELGILLKQISLRVLLKDCPLGFLFNYTLKECSCHPTLLEHQINDCDIETLKILKPSQKWINTTFTHTESCNATTGVIVHDYCPFDYCKQNTPHISLVMDYPDDQCDFNRSGILCGACQTNFSHVFGTSRCKKCSNLWALFLVPANALLGIALVILLISLNLTVSIGMINGLIFYANIVRANNAIFFTSNTFLSKFIAWLNLDLGFEVCFYNGLDAYTKTWLQLLFPVYIWGLVLTIIILSHHYTFAARLSGTNAVQVLATLFLLSYAKLIRTIITILQPTMLVYPDGFQRRVWLYDGNVDYLKGKHIPLFIVALLVLVCLSIPYTTSLLFIQWLRKYNHHRLLRWVSKLKPLFDAYTGPLKEKHCYWFGLLLLVRVALYVVFSLNVLGNTSVNLMAIGTTTSIILSYLSLMGGVYESWLANLMLVSFQLNLIILTMGTHFYGNTQAMSARSVGIAFGLFVFIVMYHLYLRVIETKRGKQLNETIKSKAKQLFSSQKVLVDYFNPVVVPPKPVSQSSIQLQESLLGDN